MNIQTEITRAIANGETLTSEFTGALHHGNFGLQAGDVFTIPTVFYVISRQTKSGPSEFIHVINQYDEVREFYPTQLTRTLPVIKLNGPVGFVRGTGSVNEYARQFLCVQDLMESLKGKTIRVTRAERFATPDGPRTLYTFDFV